MSEISMRRNADDTWPDDAPPGTFDIEPTRLEGRAATARITFVCPNAKRCGVFVGPRSESRPSAHEPNVWAWNGNADQPSITPSINCERQKDKDGKEIGGCGWHGYITDGVMR